MRDVKWLIVEPMPGWNGWQARYEYAPGQSSIIAQGREKAGVERLGWEYLDGITEGPKGFRSVDVPDGDVDPDRFAPHTENKADAR